MASNCANSLLVILCFCTKTVSESSPSAPSRSDGMANPTMISCTTFLTKRSVSADTNIELGSIGFSICPKVQSALKNSNDVWEQFPLELSKESSRRETKSRESLQKGVVTRRVCYP